VDGLPIPRQEIRYLICGIVRQPGQHVGEPSLWIDIIELACRHQGINGGCAVPSGIGACKCPIAAADGNLAVILPISGRMSSSIIAGIRCAGEARVAFRSSSVQWASSYMSS
jgi:hypothetical protein